jgi:hypothetical protein
MSRSKVVLALAAALAVCAQARAKEPESAIAGVAVADNRVLFSPASPLNAENFHFELVLNNTEDRVGASVSVCAAARGAAGGKGNRRILSCQTVVYFFPDLSYDPATKQVRSGAEIVARDRGFWHGGLALEKEFKPDIKIARSVVDRGFDRDAQLSVEVSIARAAAL